MRVRRGRRTPDPARPPKGVPLLQPCSTFATRSRDLDLLIGISSLVLGAKVSEKCTLDGRTKMSEFVPG
jgi:hypothetical protein